MPEAVRADRPSVVTEPTQSEATSPRAILTGMGCALILSMAAPYSNMIIKGSFLASNFTPIGVIFLFTFMVVGINSLLRLLRRSWAFSVPELATIYIMTLIASAIPTYGLTEVILPSIASMYYATPENQWLTSIAPHINRWLMPGDPEAVRAFFEGLPRGETIPWLAWFKPLAVWLAFILALYFVIFCVTTILRRQWIERERLVFPLVKVPIEILAEEQKVGKGLLNPFFKNRVMWLGFAIPLFINSWNSIHNYLYFFPTIDLSNTIVMFNNQLRLPLQLNFPLIGFGYLLSLEVAFSLWFFYLIAQFQNLFNATLGIDIAGSTTAPAQHQALGGLVVMVLFGLWIAREHLQAVFRKTFGLAPEVDDSNEGLSYRVACLGLIGGLFFLLAWLIWVGFVWWLALALMFLILVIFIGFARIVAEGGVIYAETMLPQEFLSRALGPILDQPHLVHLGLTGFWLTHTRTLIMPSMANGLKLADAGRIRNSRVLTWAIAATILASLVGSIYIIMTLAYTYGGINLNWHFFGAIQQGRFAFVSSVLRSTESPFLRWFFFGLGGGIMALLMYLRQRFIWWPVHFIGFPVGASGALASSWLAIFLAWVIKGVLLKYGGVRAYQKLLPFFLGLILGEFVGDGLWIIIDGLTGITGHVIFN